MKRLILTAMLVLAASTVFAASWMKVYDENKTVVYSTIATDKDMTVNGPYHVYLIDAPGIINPNQLGNYTVVSDKNFVTDVFGIASDNLDNLYLAFSTAYLKNPIYIEPTNLIVYKDWLKSEYDYTLNTYVNKFDATRYLSESLQDREWKAEYATSTVPEPSTIILLGSGLAGLGLIKRKFGK